MRSRARSRFLGRVSLVGTMASGLRSGSNRTTRPAPSLAPSGATEPEYRTCKMYTDMYSSCYVSSYGVVLAYTEACTRGRDENRNTLPYFIAAEQQYDRTGLSICRAVRRMSLDATADCCVECCL